MSAWCYGREEALTWGAGHERCHTIPSCASIAALKHMLSGLGAGFWCRQASMWVSGGEGCDAQVYVYTMVNVKARSKHQHSPVCLQFPKSFCIPLPGCSRRCYLCSGTLTAAGPHPVLAQLRGEFNLMGAGSCFPSRGASFPASHAAYVLSVAPLLSFAEWFNNS